MVITAFMSPVYWSPQARRVRSTSRGKQTMVEVTPATAPETVVMRGEHSSFPVSLFFFDRILLYVSKAASWMALDGTVRITSAPLPLKKPPIPAVAKISLATWKTPPPPLPTITFIRTHSKGEVAVLETAPEIPPARSERIDLGSMVTLNATLTGALTTAAAAVVWALVAAVVATVASDSSISSLRSACIPAMSVPKRPSSLRTMARTKSEPDSE
mmetsp:Transcript_19727/g.62747  ORF Transcript_19727/g.62747 Transcript_19727/m.62747 type:complete len:215 (-) Transcript_19727:430-1074(-)